MEVMRWRKSRKSDGANTCVEVGHTRTAVRDSKNPNGPALTVSVEGLFSEIKRGGLASPGGGIPILM